MNPLSLIAPLDQQVNLTSYRPSQHPICLVQKDKFSIKKSAERDLPRSYLQTREKIEFSFIQSL